jgi:hypothetical protein
VESLESRWKSQQISQVPKPSRSRAFERLQRARSIVIDDAASLRAASMART